MAGPTLYGTPTKVFISTGNSATLNLPNGNTQVTADTIYVIGTSERSGAPAESITGYTSIITSVIDSTDQQQIFYHIYTNGSTPPTSVTVNFDSAGVSWASAVCVAYQNFNSASPTDGSGENHFTTAASTIDAPSITTTVNNDQILEFYMAGGDVGAAASFSTTTGSLEIRVSRADSSANEDYEVWDWNKGTAGATGTDTLTWTGGNTSSLRSGVTVAIRAAIVADNPSVRLPIAAIRGNDPWWVAPPHIHQHNVVFFGPHGPGFCGRSQAAVNSSSTSVTVSFPAGTTAGDFVLVCITSSSGMCAAPAGWAQVGSTATNSISQAMGLFWKIYTVSDGASVTFGTTNINFPEAVMRVYCGVAAIDANNSATSASTVTSLQVPALTATKFSNEIYVGFWSNDDTATNGPSDLIDQTSNNYDGGVTATWSTFDGDKVLPTAGTVPPAETANLATGQPTANWMGFAVTLILMDATPALRVPPPPRTGMIPWVAPIAQARTSAADIPPSAAVPASAFPIAAIQQAQWAPIPALHPTTTLFSPANPVPYDTQMAPLQAVQAGMRQWWAPVATARHSIATFQAANPVPYDQQMAPFAAVQAGMCGWWAPVPALQATVTPFHGATENDARPAQLPLQAIQQSWWAPVPALQPTTTPFHGATENDARPSQLPLQAIQQPWQAPLPGAQRASTVPFSPANPIPYDQQMAPLAAVQAGMRTWWAPVAQVRTTTGDVTPPVATTGEPRLSQLPSAAIQSSWWAPVQALQPTTVPFSPANPPEYTTYKLPSAAVQQSWWASVPTLQPTDVLFNPANPIPYDQQMAPFAAVQSGMAGWWAPVPALQVRASWEGAAVEQRTAQLPIAAIQQGWWAPVQALQVTNTPFHGATEADARPSQLPLAAIQQPWWAPVQNLHPSTGVLFSPANPPEFTIYKLPSSAVQGSWWSPLWGAHVTSAEFKGPAPVIGVDAIVVWRHRAGMQ